MVEGNNLVFALVKELESLFEGHVVGTRTVLLVVLEFLGDFLLEGLDDLLSRSGEAILVASNEMVLSVSNLQEVLPDLGKVSDLLLILGVNRVLVHLEDSELLERLVNVELHLHGLSLDTLNAGKEVLDGVVVGLDLEAFLPVLDGLESLVKLVAGILTQSFTHHFEPFVSLLHSVRVDRSKIDDDGTVLLGLADKLLAHVLVVSELDNVKFNLTSVNHVLLHLSLLVIELVHIVELSEEGRLSQSRVVELELVDELLDLVDNVLGESSNDGVLNNVIVEGVLNHLLTGLVIDLLDEDFASLVLPATEGFGGLNNLFVEFLQLSLHLFSGGLVDDLKTVVLGLHADEGLDVAVQENGLVDG